MSAGVPSPDLPSWFLRKGCLCTVAVHLGKHEHVLLAFLVMSMTLIPSPPPPRLSRAFCWGCSCWPLGCLLVIPGQAFELALAKSVTFFDQVEAGCNAKIMTNYARVVTALNKDHCTRAVLHSI